MARRLTEHPNAICSYSGGSDSDIMIDIIERTRELFSLPPIRYVFFNTGLEMQTIKDHVKATAERYGVEIETCRPKIGIVTAAHTYGIPFVSKIREALQLQAIERGEVYETDSLQHRNGPRHPGRTQDGDAAGGEAATERATGSNAPQRMLAGMF